MPTCASTILDTIGRTPLVRLNRLAPDHVNLYAKLEAANPMGSVKDRMAAAVIDAAEQAGALTPGQTVIEATSGNTGIGLAMVCAVKGYPLVLTMAENFSIERRRILRFLGAQVVLTPAAEKGTGMLAKAVELAEHHGWFLARQFENEANALAHEHGTGPELLRAFEGESLDYFVTGFGTGGTLKGVGRALRRASPNTRVIACELDNSQVLAGYVNGVEAPPGESHPAFRPHPVQGWGPDFVPKLVRDAVAEQLIDEIVAINGGEAMRLARELATQEGIFAGISAGGTLAGALKIAEQAPAGANIVCMLPDTGERYLSTPLFEEIGVDMTADELAISRSTPGYRFDRPSASPPAAAAAPEPVPDEEASAFVEQAISDREQPVVMFALEWCEFCWAVRKLFAAFDIPYRSVDLDSVAFQQDGLGGRIRTALRARTGCRTIPQIFIGGEYIGGCTDLFAAFDSGDLRRRLETCGIEPASFEGVDAGGFLPKWLHKR